MQTTTNYLLKKPDPSDAYDKQNDNGNMDLIDGQMKANADSAAAAQNKADAAETPAGAQAKADAAELSAKTYADTQDNDLAGVGRTTESVKGNADAQAAHEAEQVTNGVHGMGSIASQTYEEGTFTPEITFGGASTGITYAYQLGRYTRTGRIIHCEILIMLSSKGTATGTAQLGGFPFVANGNPPSRATTIGVTRDITYPTNAKNIGLIQDEGLNTAIFQSSSDTVVTNLNDTNFANPSRIFTQLTYEI